MFDPHDTRGVLLRGSLALGRGSCRLLIGLALLTRACRGVRIEQGLRAILYVQLGLLDRRRAPYRPLPGGGGPLLRLTYDSAGSIHVQSVLGIV